MSEPQQTRVLAEAGSVVVVEDGPRVLVVERNTGALTTVAFVLGVLALVFGGFGLVTLVASSDVSAAVSAGGIVVGLAAAGAVVATRRAIQRQHDRPLTEQPPIAVFDRERQVLLDAGGQTVAPLSEVEIRSKMQATSSSPKLVAATPNGDVLLARGNPFSGGLGDLESVLDAALND